MALDLFCGVGGASMGLRQAGFDVTGVDQCHQPRYPFRFIRADVLRLPVRLDDFALIWASPPCQAFTLANNQDARGKHLDLIEPVRQLLASAGSAGTCIENVRGAPIRADLVLDGTMFAELRVIRRRHFELNFPAPMRLGFNGRGHVGRHGWATCTDGDNSSNTRAMRRRHGLSPRDSLETCSAAMGIDWARSRRELGSAVPPAYARFIGETFLARGAFPC